LPFVCNLRRHEQKFNIAPSSAFTPGGRAEAEGAQGPESLDNPPDDKAQDGTLGPVRRSRAGLFRVFAFAFRGSGYRARAVSSPGNLSRKLFIRRAVRAGGRRGPSGLFARDCRQL